MIINVTNLSVPRLSAMVQMLESSSVAEAIIQGYCGYEEAMYLKVKLNSLIKMLL